MHKNEFMDGSTMSPNNTFWCIFTFVCLVILLYPKKQKDQILKSNRLTWLDFAKCMAMAAVVVDHSIGYLYESTLIQFFSFYSVTTFILAAGYGIELSYERKGISYHKQFNSLIKMFMYYLVANIFGFYFIFQSLNGAEFIDKLLHFNLQGPYYYFAFFFQLIMIAPFLVKLCEKCSNFGKWKKWIAHLVVISLLCYMLKFFNMTTNLFDIYGGGHVLFGGAYLLIYYIGILLAREKIYTLNKGKFSALLALIFLGLGAYWCNHTFNNNREFDAYFSSYFGGGINPPGVVIILYALCIFSACYFIDQVWNKLIEKCSNRFINKCLASFQAVLLFLGRNTVYIYLYHLMAMAYLRNFLLEGHIVGIDDHFMVRFCVYLGALVLPAVLGAAISKVIAYIEK